MKRLFILLLALSVMGCTSTGNEEKVVTRVWPNGRECRIYGIEGLSWKTFNGRIRRITEESSVAKDHFGDIIKTRTFNTDIYSYDTDGNLIEHINRSDDGSLRYKEIFNYDDAGRMQTAYTYYPDGTMRSKEVYEYDEKGYLSRITGYDGNELSSRLILEYDNNGHVVSMNTHYENDIDPITYRYDDQGRIIEKKWKYRLYNRDMITRYQYGKQGDITAITGDRTEMFTFNDHGDITGRRINGDYLIEYIYDEYDSHDNPVKITIKNIDEEGDISLVERNIEYYE
ncbi:MAG: hypothetical protein J6K38_02010 [Alistipes sp.]|nr:hypothetical protein [Alistipes sp.]